MRLLPRCYRCTVARQRLLGLHSSWKTFIWFCSAYKGFVPPATFFSFSSLPFLMTSIKSNHKRAKKKIHSGLHIVIRWRLFTAAWLPASVSGMDGILRDYVHVVYKLYCEKQTGSRIFNQSLLFIRKCYYYYTNSMYDVWRWRRWRRQRRHVNERIEFHLRQYVIYLDFRLSDLWVSFFLLFSFDRLSRQKIHIRRCRCRCRAATWFIFLHFSSLHFNTLPFFHHHLLRLFFCRLSACRPFE